MDLLELNAKKQNKPANGALSSLHESIAAIMGPLGAAWVSLEQMRKEGTAADPATLLRNVEIAVCLLGQTLWKTTNRRRLLWLAKFLGDFKKAATFLKEEESATTASGKKLFGWAFLKRLYRRAKGTKQASMIKSVLGASKSKKLRRDARPCQPQPFRSTPPSQGFSGSWRGRGRGFGKSQGDHRPGQMITTTGGRGWSSARGGHNRYESIDFSKSVTPRANG